MAITIAVALLACGGKDTSPQSALAPTADLPDGIKQEAIDLLHAAERKRQEGDMGIALELTKQALGKWPGYTDAKNFQTSLAPEATAAIRNAAAQLTAQANAAATVQRQTSLEATAQAQASATAAAAPKMGVPFTSGDWEYTVTDLKRAKQIDTPPFSDTAVGEYAIVGIVLRNVGKENKGLSASNFTLYDGAGTKYNGATILLGSLRSAGYDGGVLSPPFGTGQMPPGVPVKYALVYDTTPGVTGLRLRISVGIQSLDVRLQ